MKKALLLIFLLFVATDIVGQETPKITIEDSLRLRLKRLDIAVTVIGDFVTTTYDMKFFNELDRTLEGELSFPLGQGQSVSNFEMDVNGSLRGAVVVKKRQARVAFENTVRKNIDPGLLEKTQGNNYKARVYPILPNSDKHLVVTYEQRLLTVDQFQTFELPLGLSEKLEHFSLNITVLEANAPPKIASGNYTDFSFVNYNDGYRATLALTDFKPVDPIVVHIPNMGVSEKVLTFNEYFYVYKKLDLSSRPKPKPTKITLLWDASYSLRNRKLDKELALLEAYIAYLKNVDIQLIVFSDRIIKQRSIAVSDGNWRGLKDQLTHIDYDGGTSFRRFKDLSINSDETLLFSDGLSNLGDFERFTDTPVYTVNSNVSADHEALGAIAEESGGRYMNLVRLVTADAVKNLKTETLQFLSAEYDDTVYEVYPKHMRNLTEDFTISGKFSATTVLQLVFGYAGKATERVTINIKPSQPALFTKRLWAKQKLKSLNVEKQINKDKITDLALRHRLLSDYTAMLILDRVEDYVRYNIEPPEELQDEYKELLKERTKEEGNTKDNLNYRMDKVFAEYKDLMKWYAQKFPVKYRRSKDRQDDDDNDDGPGYVRLNIDTIGNSISGAMYFKEDDLPMPGASVNYQNTTIGAVTDFDGHFTLPLQRGRTLVFRMLGFENTMHVIGESGNEEIAMRPYGTLEEVVVVSSQVEGGGRSADYGLPEVHYEPIYEFSDTDVTTASGLNIGNSERVETNGTIGSGEQNIAAAMRGAATTDGGNQPLYSIDGTIAEEHKFLQLSPGTISNIEIIRGDHATKLYGDKALNGLIVVTTKNGLLEKSDAIAALNEKIADRIVLKSSNPDTPYLSLLEKERTTAAAYRKYLNIRADYGNSPSFYLDVSDFFDKRGDKAIALTVLTNLIEIELDNHELIRALGYKLEYFKAYDLAVVVYRKVVQLRPEEPQSYRDLALALEKTGAIKESYDLLYKIYSGGLLSQDVDRDFSGIEQIAFVELTRLVNKYKRKLKLKPSEKKKFGKIKVDARVVIDWNHNDTDIDLWVKDPADEEASYTNPTTEIGGRLSFDVTQGYGPEEFMLRKAISGVYPITIDYYADNVQKISGPTILKVTLFTNYARKNEVCKTLIVRLDTERGEIKVGSLNF